MLLQFSGASQHSGEEEREREGERETKPDRKREYVCAGRVGPAPTHPTLTAAACRVRSAAFPEGNAEDKEEEAHF